MKGVRHFMRPFIRNFTATLSDGSLLVMDGPNYDDQKFIINEVYGQEAYEKEHRLGEGEVVVDVGANIGVFSIRAARKIGIAGTLLAIEPATKTFRKLENNIKLNDLKNVMLFQCAAGDKSGERALFLQAHDGHSSFYTRQAGNQDMEKVQVRTLDDIFETSNARKCDFLKIDTEGAELDVLKGARKVLSNYHPSISMETHKFGSKAPEIIDFLREFGYGLISNLNSDGSGYVYAGYDAANQQTLAG